MREYYNFSKDSNFNKRYDITCSSKLSKTMLRSKLYSCFYNNFYLVEESSGAKYLESAEINPQKVGCSYVRSDQQENIDCISNDKTIMESPREIYYFDINKQQIIINENFLHESFDRIQNASTKFSLKKNSNNKENKIKININKNFNSYNNFPSKQYFHDKILLTENNLCFSILQSDSGGKSSDKDYSNSVEQMGIKVFLKPIKKYMKKDIDKIILIVDDNEIIRKSIKKLIKSIYKNNRILIVCLGDGIELIYFIMIDQIMNNLVKLIICDEQMIYLNGTESFRIINN